MVLSGAVVMYTPTLGAVVAAKFVERQPRVLLNLRRDDYGERDGDRGEQPWCSW
jgi:hypothetical protein